MDTVEVVDDILAHYGVKGMRWGIRRKATVGAQEVIVSDRRKKIKTSGGAGRPAHPDAIRARTIGQVGKKSGYKALSDKELNDYAKRLQLEQNVKRLDYNEKNAGKRFVLRVLGRAGNQQADALTNKAATSAGKKIVKLAAAAA